MFRRVLLRIIAGKLQAQTTGERVCHLTCRRPHATPLQLRLHHVQRRSRPRPHALSDRGAQLPHLHLPVACRCCCTRAGGAAAVERCDRLLLLGGGACVKTAAH